MALFRKDNLCSFFISLSLLCKNTLFHLNFKVQGTPALAIQWPLSARREAKSIIQHNICDAGGQ